MLSVRVRFAKSSDPDPMGCNIDTKKNIILLQDMGTSQHETFRRLRISRRCIRQTIRKLNQFHIVTTKPCSGHPQIVTER